MVSDWNFHYMIYNNVENIMWYLMFVPAFIPDIKTNKYKNGKYYDFVERMFTSHNRNK